MQTLLTCQGSAVVFINDELFLSLFIRFDCVPSNKEMMVLVWSIMCYLSCLGQPCFDDMNF